MEDLIISLEHLVGFLVVVVTLTVLWGLTAIIGKTLSRSKLEVTHATPAIESIGSASAEDDEDLVIVATAAAQMLAERHRIISIRPQQSSWGQQGRREIHASRNIR